MVPLISHRHGDGGLDRRLDLRRGKGGEGPGSDRINPQRRSNLRMTDGYKRDLTIAAEQVLLNTPLVKIGKWFLLLAIVTGMAVWIGGSIYGLLQVKSVQDRTDEIVRQVEVKMATRTKEIG